MKPTTQIPGIRYRWSLLFIVLASGLQPAAASDPDRGGQLYENHCTTCHDSQAHIRERRKATDPEALREWVRRWQTSLQLDWTRSEVEDVAAYLDARFYRFQSTVTQ